MTQAIERAKTSIIRLSEKDLESLDQMEMVIRDCDLAMADAAGKVQKAFVMAQGIGALREMITDEMMEKHIAPLMNTRLGFKTDRDPNKVEYGNKPPAEPYSISVVKDCIIEALLRGANPVGNEFNIISGQCYFTKEFFERRLGELPGVTNVVPSPGIPRMEQGPDGKIVKALIRFGLSWKVNGVADCLRDAEGKPGRPFEIKANNYSSSDQIIGKATRKAYAAAYRQIMGSELAPPDGDVADTVDGQVVSAKSDSPDTGAAELNARAAAKAAPAPAPVTPAKSDPAPTGDTPASIYDTHEAFNAAMYEWVVDSLKGDKDKFTAGMIAEHLAMGVKGHPEELTPEQRKTIHERIEKRRMHWAFVPKS